MTKAKQQELVPSTAKRKKKVGAADVSLLGEDSWVVVKKQKVTIIIPPSPVSEQLTKPSAAEAQQQPSLIRGAETDTQSKLKGVTHRQIHSAGEREKSKSLSPAKASLNATIIHSQSIPMLPISQPDHEVGPQNFHVDRSKGRKLTDAQSSQKVIKRLAISADRSVLFNQRLRAVILQKKLKKAGGLSNWLVSLGLGRFIKIFEYKNVGKFHLASLTMEKLKNMGAYAVGPRRKLLHAIECLCQPYCFEH